MSESTIAHAAAPSAAVNAPATVTLYDPDGDPITVEAAAVDKWLARGFSRARVDLDALVAEVEAHAAALAAPWRAYADACRAAGHIDNAAQDTARAALDLLADAALRLHLAIHRTYSPAQAGEE